jgi:hypothetical protein
MKIKRRDRIAMHWTLYNGYPMPNRVGGHVALDFCNTWAGWNAEPGDPRRNWIPDYEHFAVWAKFADLIDAETAERLLRKAKREPAAAEATAQRAWQLRRAIHDVLLDPNNRSAFQVVAVAAQQANATVRLVAEDGGLAQWRFPPRSGLEQPLLAVARAAAAAGASWRPAATVRRSAPTPPASPVTTPKAPPKCDVLGSESAYCDAERHSRSWTPIGPADRPSGSAQSISSYAGSVRKST